MTVERTWILLLAIACAGLIPACGDKGRRTVAVSPPAPEAGSQQPVQPTAPATETPPNTQAIPPRQPAGQPDATPMTPSTTESPPPRPRRTEPEPKPEPEPRFSAKSLIYDRQGAGYALLQSPASAMKGFPVDSLGRVDWVETLSRGLISPRASLRGKGSMQRRTDDIIMRNTLDMPWVRFPHAQHTEWLDCSNCHPRPFKQQSGANEITMTTIMRGEHCGLCHDRVAFSVFACERCHSVTHPGSPPAWW